MAPSTDAYLPNLPEAELAEYKKAINVFANVKNGRITKAQVRWYDHYVSKAETKVRLLEAIKNGHNRYEHDPRVYKINYKLQNTLSQLLVKWTHVKYRTLELECYYGILGEPLGPRTKSALYFGEGCKIAAEVDEIVRHIERLYSYLMPDDVKYEQLQMEVIPDNLPHVKGPLNLEEVRKKVRDACEKYRRKREREIKGKVKWLRLEPDPMTQEEMEAMLEANFAAFIGSMGYVEEDGEIRRIEKGGRISKPTTRRKRPKKGSKRKEISWTYLF